MAATKPKPVKPGAKYLNGVGELATYTGLHPHTCNKYIKRGLLPKPRKPSSRFSMFVVTEVDDAIASWPRPGDAGRESGATIRVTVQAPSRRLSSPPKQNKSDGGSDAAS